jgi:hypothetical protein
VCDVGAAPIDQRKSIDGVEEAGGGDFLLMIDGMCTS